MGGLKVMKIKKAKSPGEKRWWAFFVLGLTHKKRFI